MVKQNEAKILVVDENAIMQQIIKTVLRQIGYEDVVLCRHGMHALDMLDAHPDIGMLMTDWHMPTMNGLALVRAVRNDQRHIAMPILMMTTESQKVDVITALKAGVNHYIVKPFTPESLSEKIGHLLRRD